MKNQEWASPLSTLSTIYPQKKGFAPQVGPEPSGSDHWPPAPDRRDCNSLQRSLSSLLSLIQSMAQPEGSFKPLDHTAGPASLLPLL